MELYFSDHLFFFLVGVFIPLRTVMGTQPEIMGMKFTTRLKLQLYWGNNLYLWVLAAAAAGIWWFNDRGFADIGLRWPPVWPKGMPLYVLVGFAGLYLADTFLELRNVVQQSGEETEKVPLELGFLPQSGYEYLHFTSVAITAGFCEELIFRGYFIRYFQLLLGLEDMTHTLAILLPALIFGIVHLYQGWRSVVKITSMAIVFGYVFVHTESLWWLMALHAGIDMLAGALAWWLGARGGGREA